VEVRTLRYFAHVADARSFSKASLHLRVAQPALSRQIQKLETEIGLPLFVRAGRHLELTEAGQLLLDRAHILLRQVSNTLDDVRASTAHLGGTLTVGVSPATSELVAPLLMGECARRHPQLRLDFVEGFSRQIFDQLVNQDLTLCLIHNPPPHKAIEIHPLLVEAMYLVGPPPRRAAMRQGPKGLPPVTARTRLESLPLVLPNETHALRRLVERALGRHRLAVAVQTDGMVTTRALVAGGHGYTILPYSAIHHQLVGGQVSARRLSEIEIPWMLSLACRRDPLRARAVMAVRDILAAHFERLGRNSKWGCVPRHAKSA
jgi:LysR family transcriptional regulator, nitrogen assimilation regulatory protein